jgi:hypothetical protein
MLIKKYSYRLNNIFNNFLGYITFSISKKIFYYDWNLYLKRYEIIQNIINKKNFKSFLEIGSFNNDTFDKILIAKKIGVDPEKGGNVRLTSDDFFKTNKSFFDIIFIDGLHLYEQVRKDFFNSLNFLNPGGIILIHDCLPNKFRDQARLRSHTLWNGDVWKLIVELRTLDYLELYTIIADHGVAIIKLGKNKDILKVNTDIKKLNYKDYCNNHNKYMNTISYEELVKNNFF